MSLDFEANTKRPEDPNLYIRTVALANDSLVVGIDFLNCAAADWDWMMGWLCEQQLVVFNCLYDHALIYRKARRLVSPHADCYIAFKMLGGKKYIDANVGHSLKWAQVELLGWDAMGDSEIDAYMEANGLTWEEVRKFDREILLRYNCLDADSTWALYKLFQDLCKEHWDTWGQYFGAWHREDCLTAALAWIEAIDAGMPVDEDQLRVYTDMCTRDKDKYLQAFMEHPLLKDGIREYNEKHCASIWDNPPTQYTKDGRLTANWVKRQAKYEAALKENHFNTNSPQQLQWLLYGHAKIASPKPNLSTDAESLQQIGEVGQLLLSYRNMVTELKFLTQLTDNNMSGVFHPSVRFPATKTGRVASGEST
jgi:hypothetical protein